MSNNRSSDSKFRLHVIATLGAEVHRQGLGYEDRDAFRAVLEMPLARLIDAADADAEQTSLGETIAKLVQVENGPLSILGQSILHDRQAEKYRADCASWSLQPASIKNGSWRKKRPTREQQMLMLRMAKWLEAPLPGDITRGEAHDWILAHGGNPRFKGEI